MSIYNSKINSNEDDSDITIICPSIVNGHVENGEASSSYVPILTRLKQANDPSETRQRTEGSYGKAQKSEYIFVEQDLKKSAQQLEEILRYYAQDLKSDNQTLIACDRQLVIRLMDLIRPAYPTDQQKMIVLDKLMAEISAQHDQRHVEQQEKIEQLKAEICQLNRRILSLEDRTILLRNNSECNYCSTEKTDVAECPEQWTEIEDDAKKLHEIIRSQQDHIDEIVKLISRASLNQKSSNTDVAVTNNDTTTIPPTNTLLQRYQIVTSQNTTKNPSPGSSPTESFVNLVRNGPTVNPQASSIDLNTVESPISDNSIVCPLCNKKFPETLDDGSKLIEEHFEVCLAASEPTKQPLDYVCPACERKFAADDETTYHQHLSDCINRDDFQ